MRHAWIFSLVAACGTTACPPSRSHIPELEQETAGAESDRPALSGAYRITTLAGEPVVESLVRDPACYAGRALFTFGDDGTLSFSLETACDGSEHYDTVCAAELTAPIEWEGAAFRVPFAARARGTVSQLYETPEDGAEGAVDFDDSCHVGITPMRWRVIESTDAGAQLENDHGDVMVLERETHVDVDWRAIIRAAREQRASVD